MPHLGTFIEAGCGYEDNAGIDEMNRNYGDLFRIVFLETHLGVTYGF